MTTEESTIALIDNFESTSHQYDVKDTSSSAPPSGDAHYYYFIVKLLYWLTTLIVMVGLVGNMISLKVMMGKHHAQRSVSVYLSALAISDILVLIVSAINTWLSSIVGFQIEGTSHYLCKFHTWALGTSFTVSAWLVVAVSIERFIVVCFPLRASRFCTAKNAKLSVVIIWILIAALRAVRLWAWERTPDGRCAQIPGWGYYANIVLPWMMGTFYSYIPLVILVFTNTCICVKIYRQQRKQAQLTNRSANVRNDDTTNRVTRTVVAVCLTHLVLTTPASVWQLIKYTNTEFISHRAEAALVQTVCYIMATSNYCVNIFLYVLVSTSFRQEVKQLFHCGSSLTKKNRDKENSEPSKSVSERSFQDIGTSISNISLHEIANPGI